MKDAIGNVQRVVVLGGTSEIALATVARLTAERRGVQVTLAARPGERRTSAAADLDALGLQVSELDFEATERSSYERAISDAFESGGGRRRCHGRVRAVGRPEARVAGCRRGNGTGAGQLHSGNRLRRPGRRQAAQTGARRDHRHVLRGRRTPQEVQLRVRLDQGGMDAFYTGLGDALEKDGIQVLVVRPGFVKSKMTHGLAVAPLSQTPEQVADVIVAGLLAGRRTVWAPPAMRWVMAVLRHLPRQVFTRLPV